MRTKGLVKTYIVDQAKAAKVIRRYAERDAPFVGYGFEPGGHLALHFRLFRHPSQRPIRKETR
jgi:hypothetical protein